MSLDVPIGPGYISGSLAMTPSLQQVAHGPAQNRGLIPLIRREVMCRSCHPEQAPKRRQEALVERHVGQRRRTEPARWPCVTILHPPAHAPQMGFFYKFDLA